MKKAIIILSLLVFTSSVPALAQTDTRDMLTGGFKVGANLSNVWDEQGQDFTADPKVGFAGGVFLGIPIGEFLGFQPELLLSQKGFQGSGTMLTVPYSFSRTTTYIDVPLQLQVKPSANVTLLVGPNFSYLIHQKDVFTAGGSSGVIDQEFDNEDIRKNLLGMVAGADFSFDHFLIGGRAGWDFQRNNGDNGSTAPRYRNQWLQLAVGYKLY